ncbi:MAG: dTDP-glucose 4,6-dehydratase [Sedimentisphaerales bacterium]|nr:dTDP-glucose 4,6-dehydratase [Sedimentisphaerales bacterium]
MKLLVTGAAGFIGANFVRLMLKGRGTGKYKVIAFDALTYAGNLANLKDFEEQEDFEFIKGDIRNPEQVETVMEDVGAVVNFAAESHVDRSILAGADFISTNIDGVRILAEAAVRHGVKRFIQVSTDEVYGSLESTGLFREDTPLHPNSPYSASKAAGDLLALAWQHTFGLPVIITRCSNNYGPYQFPEKLIPLFITNLMEDKKVPVYGDGMQVRDWIHVMDHCRAILIVLEKGRVGEVYNIGGGNERTNIDITRRILRLLRKDESFIEHVTDRPGHDRRYAIDASKITGELGWRPEVVFEAGLAETIEWYRNNESWWQAIKSGDYLNYYQQQYGRRGVIG